MRTLINTDIKKIIKPSIFCLAFFVVDRILKILSLHGKIFFYKNYGLSFSISIPNNLFLFFYIFNFIILLIIVWQLLKVFKNNYNLSYYKLPASPAGRQIIGYGLFLLGIISNLLDRLKYGFVIDYFNFYFFYNNLADIMLIVGALLISYQYLKKSS